MQHFAASACPPKHAARRELHMRGPHNDQQDSIRTPVCRGTTTVSRIEPHVAQERWKITPIRARNAARAGPGQFRPRPHRRRPDSRGSTSSEPKKAPRLLAGLVAWQAHSANLRPERINRARRRHADLTDQGGAAISFATHATVVVIDEESRNPIELSIALRGEPRPIRRKRTTGTASPAYRRPTIERVNGIEHHRPKHLRAVHHAASHGGTAAIFVESPCESPDRSSRNSWPKDS